jgi:hypothetical protein
MAPTHVSTSALRIVSGLLATVALGLAGCDSGPKTYPVKGKLVVQGSQRSLEGVTIMFESVENPSVQASGYVNEDGSFELFSNQGKPGTLEGEHRILIVPPEQEYGQNKLVDDRFRAYATSGLTRTVKPGDNDFTIEVEPPKRR